MKNNMDIQIRLTSEDDFNIISEVEEKAFGFKKEAELTIALLNDETAKPYISLLAYHNEKPVGHILFSRSYFEGKTENSPLMHILAPLAVIPEYQKKGIGGKLIREGLRILKKMDSKIVFVLGHIEYYPKHGFIKDAAGFGYKAPYPIPEKYSDAWMYQRLEPKGSNPETGSIVCANALNKPEHWRE